MRIASLLIVVFFSLQSYGQSVNGYLKELKIANSDTAFINLYNLMCEYYVDTNKDSAEFYNKQSLSFSYKTENDAFNFKGYYLKALLLLRQQKYGEALSAVEVAKQISVQNNNTAQKIEALILCGNIFSGVKQADLAVQNYSNAFNLSNTCNNKKGIVSSATSLGLYFKENNKNTNALGYFLEVYPVAKALKDTESIFNCCINLGSLYERTNDKDKALEFYREALAINSGDNDENAMAICYFKMGRLFANLGRKDSSEYFLGKTMVIHLKRKDELGLIFDYAFLASLNYKAGNYTKAEQNYDSSLCLAFKHNDSMRISSVYSYKASMYKAKPDQKKALENYEKSIRFLSSGMPGETRMMLYQNIAGAYKKLGKYKEASDNFEKAKMWADSVYNVNETKRQTELKLNFEFNQIKEKINSELEAKEIINRTERENERQKRYYLLAGMVLISLFLVIVIINFRALKKANLIIEEQKKITEGKQKEIIDSIYYARRIQKSLMSCEKNIQKTLDRLSENT